MDNVEKTEPTIAVETAEETVKAAPLEATKEAIVSKPEDLKVEAAEDLKKIYNEAAKKASEDTVVVYSLRDISLESGAHASIGYSRVKKSDANDLLQYSSVRIASQEEIKTYFSK